MIHFISPGFHGGSNGDNYMIAQHPDGHLGHPLEQQHVGGDHQ